MDSFISVLKDRPYICSNSLNRPRPYMYHLKSSPQAVDFERFLQCIYTYIMHPHIHIYMYINTYIYICVWMHYICVHIHICTYTSMYIYIHTGVMDLRKSFIFTTYHLTLSTFILNVFSRYTLKPYSN